MSEEAPSGNRLKYESRNVLYQSKSDPHSSEKFRPVGMKGPRVKPVLTMTFVESEEDGGSVGDGVSDTVPSVTRGVNTV